MDEELDKIYYSPDSPACYAGIGAVYREAKKVLPYIKYEDVKTYLNKQRTYTLHKPRRKKFKRNKFVATHRDSHWQADLCDMQALARYNKGHKYILTCIDVLSKYAWAVPIKNKKPESVCLAFQEIFKSGRQPWWLYTDCGKEFVGKPFQDFAEKNNFIHRTTRSPDIKAGVCERFNRTLKTRLWKYFTHKKTFKYLDILPEIVGAINNSYSTAIGCRPVDVTQENEMEIKARLSGARAKPKYRFNVNDRVRISRDKGVFSKGYLPNFTEEIFIITERLPRHPPVYRIKDLNGEEIEGIFYAAEMVPSGEKV